MAIAADASWYAPYLTAQEYSLLKVFGIALTFMVGTIWTLVEIRTQGKFAEIVNFSKTAATLADAANKAAVLVTEKIETLNNTLTEFATQLKHTAETDSASTKAMSERLDRHTNKITFLENRLSGIGRSVTILEVKAGMDPGINSQNHNEETTT